MERISAAEQMTIEMSEVNWRLINNGSREPSVLFEAASGQPLAYLPDFASTRRLPKSGFLPVEQIQRIVLGWSPSDESWHLGLMLEGDLAQARGSRWCEIARWPDPHTTTFNEIASRAGRNLATVMTRPFSLVPPQPAEPEPVRDLPELPLKLGDDWRLERNADGLLQLAFNRRWARIAIQRMLWYSFWVVIYFLLVYLTLTSNVAPPNPAFLPYLGILAAVILVGLVIKNIHILFTKLTNLVIDDQKHEIRAEHGRRSLWTFRDQDLKSLYVSQIMGKQRNKPPTPQYGEINLHLMNGNFRLIMSSNEIAEHELEDESVDESVLMLSNSNFTTDLQAAGLYIAQALDIPAWYDRRWQ